MEKIFTKKAVEKITIGWVVFVFILIVLKRDSLTGMELNSIGDFLAGVFAPLGFFWLVAGYYQQGKELKQNTEALRLQAQELQNSVQEQRNSIIEQKNSVKQQEAQVKLLEEQLAKNLEWQLVQMNQREPIFSLILRSLDTGVKITNLGGIARSIFVYENGNKIPINNGQLLKLGETAYFKLSQTYTSAEKVQVRINYINQQNEKWVSFYTLEQNDDLGLIFILNNSKKTN